MIQMTQPQILITIGAIFIGTMVTRFLPFLIFPANKPTPKFVQYLGVVLPSAALGMLVVYCFKDTNFLGATHGLPEIISLVLIVVLHCAKRNILISIAGGTICYMLLVQFVFVA